MDIFLEEMATAAANFYLKGRDDPLIWKKKWAILGFHKLYRNLQATSKVLAPERVLQKFSE
jgi:hypothetical protein